MSRTTSAGKPTALCRSRTLEDFMRAFRFLNLTILSILVASSAALYAQDQQEEKPRHEEPKRQEEARPAGKQDEMKPPRQDEAKPSKQEKQEQKQQEKQSHEQMKPSQSGNAQQGHARPAGKSAHIPDEKFRAQFGRQHTLKVQRPVIVQGSPGFFYGGYSFVFVDAWPVEWAYTDDCYVDYIDGEYFLFDLFHPGVRIAVLVVE